MANGFSSLFGGVSSLLLQTLDAVTQVRPRVLKLGAGLLLTDNADGTASAAVTISSLTADGSPDSAADYVMTYDASATALKKVLLDDLPSGGGGAAFSGAKVYSSVDQTISHTGFTTLAWDREEYDTDAIHDTDTNNSRLTVPAGKTGAWRVSGFIDAFASSSTTQWYCRVSVNGGDRTQDVFVVSGSDLAQDTQANFSIPIGLAAGDYVEMTLRLSSAGADADLFRGADNTFFAMEYLGATA